MMTKEQVTKLQNIMRIAKNNGNQTTVDLCKEIMYIDVMNKRKKESKFDIYDYVLKDVNIRPAMASVHYENGEMVASDGKILIVLKKQEYEERFEGKNVMKDGKFAVQRYPNYHSIKPQKNTKHIQIDFDKFDEILKEDNAKVKLMDKDDKKNYYGIVKVGVDYFKLSYFKKLVDFMKVIGTNEIMVQGDEVSGGRFACMAESDKGWGVLMPIIRSEEPYYEL